jgi:hypothetical protein
MNAKLWLSRPDAAEGVVGSTGVPPVPAGVPPDGPRHARGGWVMYSTRQVNDSAGRRAGQAGRLCYPCSGAQADKS